MECEFCHQTLEPDAPIYRVARWGFGPFVSEVCAACCASKPHPDDPWMKGHQWRIPVPCKRCGRPVIQDLRRKRPKHIACKPAIEHFLMSVVSSDVNSPIFIFGPSWVERMAGVNGLTGRAGYRTTQANQFRFFIR